MAKTAAEADPPAVITVPFFLVCMALPYFLGCLISTHNLAAMQTLLGPLLAVTTHAPLQKRRASVPLRDLDQCYQKLLVKMHRGRDQKRRDEPFTNLKIVMHRNGQSRPCGDTGTAHVMQEFKQALEEMNECPTDYGDKYQVEALWTRVLHRLVATACPSEDGQPAQAGFYGYCDMGPDKTPILPDHGDLVPVVDTATPSGTEYLPCHFHTHQGLRVTSLPYLAQLARHAVAPKTATNDECKVDGDNDDDVSATCAAAALNDKEEEMLSRDEQQQQQPRELHLYAVPAGRVFMHAPSHVGEIIALPHVQGGDPSKLVYLEVLSVSPRVFELVNFFTKTESADLVERALKETSESHRIKQSSTGAVGYNLNSKRTSESGFDTTGKTAMIVKKCVPLQVNGMNMLLFVCCGMHRLTPIFPIATTYEMNRLIRRCFDVLGFDEYQESFSDGLQILRYNLTKAYVSHMDWIEGSDLVEHDYDSAGKGGNRFSTILLYMSDLGPDDGGETVFTEAWPVGQAEEDRVSSTSVRILYERLLSVSCSLDSPIAPSCFGLHRL
jgi:hypothetical protein